MSWTCPKCDLHISGRVVCPVNCVCGHRDTCGLPIAENTYPSEALRELWSQLHRHAIIARKWKPEEARQWFELWQSNVPTANCNCSTHWKEILKELPPDFSSREAFFAWSVAAHNKVNERLGKPVLSLHDAHRLHGFWRESKGTGPRVGFVSAAYAAIGGTETWHQTIVPRLVEAGVRVEGLVATGFPGGDPVPLGCRYGVGIEAARRLAADVDVLIVWGVDNIGQILPTSHRPKVVCIHHGDLSNTWNTGIVTQAGVDVIVAVNPDVASELGGTYIPNAVDPQRIVTDSPAGRDGRKTLVWCARFALEKRVHLAIDAARLMPDWHFVVIGSGSDQPTDPPSNVTLTGKLHSQADWLAVADAFLSTGDQEGFGYSMAEAMLAGVPVVATPFGLGANADIVMQLNSNPTPEEIAGALRKTAGNPSKIAKAREFIEQNHSLDFVVEQWVNLIAKLGIPCGCTARQAEWNRRWPYAPK